MNTQGLFAWRICNWSHHGGPTNHCHAHKSVTRTPLTPVLPQLGGGGGGTPSGIDAGDVTSRSPALATGGGGGGDVRPNELPGGGGGGAIMGVVVAPCCCCCCCCCCCQGGKVLVGGGGGTGATGGWGHWSWLRA